MGDNPQTRHTNPKHALSDQGKRFIFEHEVISSSILIPPSMGIESDFALQPDAGGGVGCLALRRPEDKAAFLFWGGPAGALLQKGSRISA